MRVRRIELLSHPWQGRVLPLNHTRLHCHNNLAEKTKKENAETERMNQSRHITDIFLLKNSATPTRTVALRPCEAPSIRFSPRRASATPKEKHSLHFWFGGGEISFEKGKGVFLSGFCPPSIRAGGGTMRTRFCQNYFLGKGFGKTLG